MLSNRKPCKPNRIPAFIKAIKRNKTNLLGSLRHKTAISIDDSNFFNK
jgi:hypothetical protein